jgi:hypothetical protein
MAFALLSATQPSLVLLMGPEALRPRLTTGLPFRGQFLQLLYGNPIIVLSVGLPGVWPEATSGVSLAPSPSRGLSASLPLSPKRLSAPIALTLSAAPVSSR